MTRDFLRMSAPLIILAFSGSAQVRADYLYTVSGLPAPIVNGQSIVVFSANPSPNHPIPGTTSTDLALANVLGFSTNAAGGNSFNTPFTLKINFADPAHPGSDAVASFTGTLTGTLGSNQSPLFVRFPAQADNTAHINLAGNTYAVSMMAIPATAFVPEDLNPEIIIPVSSDGTQQSFGIHVQFTGFQTYNAPEPSTLLLAGFGLPLWGLKRLRKRAARA